MRIECGVDWLSGTISAEHQDYPKVIQIAQRLQKEQQDEKNTIKPQKILGYEGTICGSVFVGVNHQGAMVRASGFVAQKALAAFKMVQIKVTRIDLQISAFYDDNVMPIIRRKASQAIADNTYADGRTRRNITTIEGNDGGYTLYVGKRESAYFGRVYDKYKESKSDDYKNCLRFEVEIKEERAEQVYTMLQRSTSKQTSVINTFVGEWFTSRGVYCEEVYKGGSIALEPIKRETSDTARRLNWLESQVRRTVLELRKTVDSTVILDALGFFEPLEQPDLVNPYEVPAEDEAERTAKRIRRRK